METRKLSGLDGVRRRALTERSDTALQRKRALQPGKNEGLQTARNVPLESSRWQTVQHSGFAG